MTDKESKKIISNVVSSSFASHLIKVGSKITVLEQYYQAKLLQFDDEVSEQGRALTKKIFGTAIRCVRSKSQDKQICFPASLVGLGFILLNIAFQDQYVMRLVIQQINSCHDNLNKMLQKYNPFASIDLNATSLQRIFVEIVLKIDSWRSIFSMNDIMRDYYTASEAFAIFMRSILVKVGYENAENLQKKLNNCEQIFTILCDYFDLNVIPHRANTLKRRSSVGQNTQNADLGQKAAVYLFSNYNLFISTVDNEQFCCGKYYSNETELLTSEKQMRKSTFEFIMKYQQVNKNQSMSKNLMKQKQKSNSNSNSKQKQKNKLQFPSEKQKAGELQIQSEQDENQQKPGGLRISQFDLDLGMSNSGIMFGNQGDTPYFSTVSNADTPQFGGLMDSMRFRKSIDFETAIKFVENKREPDLGIVEQELITPCSEVDRLAMKQSAMMRKFCNEDNTKTQLTDSKISKFKVSVSSVPKKQGIILQRVQEEDPSNKPRSPPSIEAQKKQITQSNVTTQKNIWDNSRQLTFNYEKKPYQNNQKTSFGKQTERSLEKEKILKQSSCIFEKFEKYDISKLRVPEISKKSVLENNSDMKSESRVELNSFEKQFKSFVNMSVKESQHFVKFQQNIEQITQYQRRKKNYSSRKYSANDGVIHDIAELHKKNTFVHHSNHFGKMQQFQQMTKTRKTENNYRTNVQNFASITNNRDTYWQNTKSDNLHMVNQRKNQQANSRKMQFSSNVINFQFSVNQQYSHNIQVTESPATKQINNQDKEGYKNKNKNTKFQFHTLPTEQQRRKKILEMKERIEALRYSKSSNNSKSPRVQFNQKPKSKIKRYPSDPGQFIHQPQSQIYKQIRRKQKNMPTEISQLNIINIENYFRDERSPRRNSKFPEFLRYSKSRKTIQYNQQQLKSQLPAASNAASQVKLKRSHHGFPEKVNVVPVKSPPSSNQKQTSKLLHNNSPVLTPSQSKNYVQSPSQIKSKQPQSFQVPPNQTNSLSSFPAYRPSSKPNLIQYSPTSTPFSQTNSNLIINTPGNNNNTSSFFTNNIQSQLHQTAQQSQLSLTRSSKHTRSQPQLLPNSVQHSPQQDKNIIAGNNQNAFDSQHNMRLISNQYTKGVNNNNNNNVNIANQDNFISNNNSSNNNSNINSNNANDKKWQYFGNTSPEGFHRQDNQNASSRGPLSKSNVIQTSYLTHPMAPPFNSQQQNITRQSCPAGITLNSPVFQSIYPHSHHDPHHQKLPYYYHQQQNCIPIQHNPQPYISVPVEQSYILQSSQQQQQPQQYRYVQHQSNYPHAFPIQSSTTTMNHQLYPSSPSYMNMNINMNINNGQQSTGSPFSSTLTSSIQNQTVRSSKILSTKVDSPSSVSTVPKLYPFNAVN